MAPVLLARAAGVASLAVAALCGCSSGSSPHHGGGSTASAQLSHDASLAQGFQGTAHYALYAPTRPSGTAVVQRAGTDLRLDVVTPTTTATLLQTSAGTFVCSKSTRTTCVRVGGPGAALPAALDPGLEKTVVDAAQSLATTPSSYSVTGAPGRTAAGISADCFAVTPTASGAAAVAGTYCFGSTTGVLVYAAFPDSSTVTLTSYDGTAPAASAFAPPASPQPLPSPSTTP